MRRLALSIGIAVALNIAMGIGAQTVAIAQAREGDPRVADLVRRGELRVGLGLGVVMQAVKDPETGELRGAALELARALATRIGVKLVLIEYQRPGAVLDGLRSNAWDVSFLVFDPERAGQVDFSHVFLQSDLTYLTPAGSAIRKVVDVDRPGIRIAVPRGDGSDLYLSRTLKSAELVRTETHAAALELLRTGRADAKASSRFVLATEVPTLPGSQLLDGASQRFLMPPLSRRAKLLDWLTLTNSLRRQRHPA